MRLSARSPDPVRGLHCNADGAHTAPGRGPGYTSAMPRRVADPWAARPRSLDLVRGLHCNADTATTAPGPGPGYAIAMPRGVSRTCGRHDPVARTLSGVCISNREMNTTAPVAPKGQDGRGATTLLTDPGRWRAYPGRS